MTNPGDDRAAMQARNAARRDTLDGLLAIFHKQTAQLQEAQQARSAPSGLKIAPSAFERIRPETLSRTILELTRRASSQVRQPAADDEMPSSWACIAVGTAGADAQNISSQGY